MTSDTPKSPQTVIEPGELGQYMLRTHAEIQVVLRGLCDRVSQITVFFNEGEDMLLTTLAEVGDDHLILDYGPSNEINHRSLAVEKHFCVSMLDKVRVQFILRGFSKVEHEGRPAFRCALPDEVLRLQRREFYRMVTPIMRPLKCTMPIHLADGRMQLHEAGIFDISVGGLGVSVPADKGIPFGRDMVLPGCRIELPEVGFVVGTLCVRSVFNVALKSGAHMRRAGCEFIDLPGPMATLIQRYIIKVERERKARESGLG
ncbi:MAG: flagellar brake protein [Rhodocyclaceae bacterium]|nr:flagellar brake protein [Rhodocyclaceae bacterium]MDZ4215262.1 flagellar brake protein [Rhodocyclaceae bacterium]